MRTEKMTLDTLSNRSNSRSSSMRTESSRSSSMTAVNNRSNSMSSSKSSSRNDCTNEDNDNRVSETGNDDYTNDRDSSSDGESEI